MKFLLLLALGMMAVQANDKLIDEFISGNARFTEKVYRELLKSNSGNFMVCPLSVEIILGLMHCGAKGNTAKQLSAGLELPESTEKVEETFSKLLPTLRSKDEYTLSSANKIYLKGDLKINQHFKDVAINNFHSDLQNIDFANRQAAVTEINKWVEDKTQRKIKDILEVGDVDANTIAVLVNAIYFQGSWLHKFHETATTKKKFYLNDKNHVDIDMMEVTNHFNYYENSELNAKFLEMQYNGGDVSMVLVLPNNKEGLSVVEGRLNEVFTATKFTNERVHVEIPKFKIETSIPFVPILQALGIVDAFEPQADFTGITGDRSMLISQVIQKTFVDVDEKGTSAAAATAVVASRTSGRDPRTPKEFIADRPFICYIKSKSVIIFVGRFTGN